MSGITTAEAGMSAEAWGWVRAAQGGDREAFARLYVRYAPEVSRFVRRRVPDAALAEDLTSETFLRAWRRIDTLRERRADPGAWVTTIARNLIADHVKSARYRLDRPVAEIPAPRAELDEQGVAELAAARADRASAARVVADCLTVLTPDQRRALALYETAPDWGAARAVADAMDRTPGAVKGLRRRALAAMRAHLADQGLFGADDCYQSGFARPRPRRARSEASATGEPADADPAAGIGTDPATGTESDRERPPFGFSTARHGTPRDRAVGAADGAGDGTAGGAGDGAGGGAGGQFGRRIARSRHVLHELAGHRDRNESGHCARVAHWQRLDHADRSGDGIGRELSTGREPLEGEDRSW